MNTVRAFARDHVVGLTALLATVSVALVFAAVGGVIPSSVVPHAPSSVLDTIPHVNTAVSTAALVTTAVGWRAIRRGNITRHRALMLSSAVLFALFLVLYLYRMILEGTTPFGGPEAMYLYVYLPLLAIHILFAIICIPLVYYVLLLAGTHSVAEIPQTNHARVGRVAAALWIISFALGDVVYLLLYVVY